MTYTEADDSGDCSSNNGSGSGSISSVMRIGEVFDTISDKHHSPTNSSTTSTSTTTTNLTQTSSMCDDGNSISGSGSIHKRQKQKQRQRKRQRQQQRLRKKALRLENKPEREKDRNELLRILAATGRVCTVCAQPKQDFRWKELGLPNRLTITCVLCAERKKNTLSKILQQQQYRSGKSSAVHQQQPTKRSGTSKPKSKMLSPTSCTSFIPAKGLTIDELLKGMTTVRIAQQPNDEDRTYVVDDDDKSIQTTTTTMAMLYPPPLENTTLLVGWSVGFHNSINTKKNKEEDDITTITVATTTTLASTITLNDVQQDSTNTNYGGGDGDGRREGIESFLLGSLLDLDEDSNERRKK